jgi:hypothetical protein
LRRFERSRIRSEAICRRARIAPFTLDQTDIHIRRSRRVRCGVSPRILCGSCGLDRRPCRRRDLVFRRGGGSARSGVRVGALVGTGVGQCGQCTRWSDARGLLAGRWRVDVVLTLLLARQRLVRLRDHFVRRVARAARSRRRGGVGVTERMTSSCARCIGWVPRRHSRSSRCSTSCRRRCRGGAAGVGRVRIDRVAVGGQL